MNALVQQYQSHVLGPQEIVDYSAMLRQGYPSQAFQTEPFIGFKILCKDTNAGLCDPPSRLRQIDANLGCLIGKGCILRETAPSMPDGIWVISLPAARSQVSKSLNNMFDVMATLEKALGIRRQGLCEINVSGKCHITQTEQYLSELIIPTRYSSCLVVPNNTAYRMGHVIRINDMYMLFRTRWEFPSTNPIVCFEDLIMLSQVIASMYH